MTHLVIYVLQVIYLEIGIVYRTIRLMHFRKEGTE